MKNINLFTNPIKNREKWQKSGAFRLDDASGAIIAGVLRDGPGAQAGLKVGDVIQTLDGRKVEDTNRLLGRLAAMAPGQKVTIGIIRAAKPQKIEAVLGERPSQPR